MKANLALLFVLGSLAVVSATVYFEEKFDDTWEKRWIVSDWKKKDDMAGEWKYTAGQWYGDAEADKGIQTAPDARFYAISAEMDKVFDNKGKDLVVQFSAKHEQNIDCGGGYIKLLGEGLDQKTFGGDSAYEVMFGPDICGSSTKRIHAILTYKGNNLLTKKTTPCETDQLTHVYTFIIHPNNTYKILTDNEEKISGSLYDDWDFLKPKKIKDPKAKKPADWVDDEYIDDPEDKKPEGYDDIPAEIVDPEAKKPDDWDDEDDGEWEAPTIPNPEYKGEWKPKRIKNPTFKGKWEAPKIDNPDFVDDKEVYVRSPVKYVGFELWQVKAGTIFDNILVTDDVEYAKKFAEDTWGKSKDAEKTMFDALEKEREAKEEEERKKMAEEAGSADEDDGDDSDDSDEAAETAEAAEKEEDDEEEDVASAKDEL